MFCSSSSQTERRMSETAWVAILILLCVIVAASPVLFRNLWREAMARQAVRRMSRSYSGIGSDRSNPITRRPVSPRPDRRTRPRGGRRGLPNLLQVCSRVRRDARGGHRPRSTPARSRARGGVSFRSADVPVTAESERRKSTCRSRPTRTRSRRRCFIVERRIARRRCCTEVANDRAKQKRRSREKR